MPVARCPHCGKTVRLNENTRSRCPKCSGFMILRASMSSRTHLTLAREGKLISVARGLHRENNSANVSDFQPIVVDNRQRKLAPKNAHKVLLERLAMLKKDLKEFLAFQAEGLDAEKLIAKTKKQIEELEKLI